MKSTGNNTHAKTPTTHIRKIAATAMMLALATIFQTALTQVLVGPLVNMTLFVTTALIGITAGLTVGCFTPLMAFVLGVQPLPVMIPFIALGNVILVLAFGLISKKLKFSWSDLVGILAAAVLKFAFLATAIQTLVPLVMPKVPQKLVTAFTLPQLVTALIGGGIALVLIRALKVVRKH